MEINGERKGQLSGSLTDLDLSRCEQVASPAQE